MTTIDHKLRELISSRWLLIFAGSLIGIIIFIAVYGVRVVIPTNTDWLLTGGDLSQHYIGWEFFRNSEWTFPVGVAKDLAYPHGLAITFMDSLPLLAIPFKVISGVLPEQFQYFGAWGLFSYAALGGFAAVILRRWTKDIWVIVPAVIFVCLSPIVFQRMFTHTALASHWVILAAIYAMLNARKWSLRKNCIVWSVVLSVSVLIHPYFLAMNVFVLLLAVVLGHETYRRSISFATIPAVAAIMTTWIIGGFTFSTISGQKFGEAGYDIAAPLLPNGWSLINLPPLQTKAEMFAYVGIGGMILFAASTVIVLRRHHVVKVLYRRYPRKSKAIMILLLLMVIAAIGPGVKIAGMQIVHIDLPAVIEKIWGIFRVTARLAWPLWYGALLGALYVIIRSVKDKRMLRIVLVVICVVQLVDITCSTQLAHRHHKFESVQNERFVSMFRSHRWQDIVDGRRHIVYLGDLYEGDFIQVAQFAVEHNLTLNTGYFARKPTTSIEQTIADAKYQLKRGDAHEDTIYLYDEPLPIAGGLSQNKIDGYFVTVR